MSESNWKSDGYVPDQHGFWRATLDDRADLGYPVGYYYADTIRAVMIAFGSFFNDLYVIRYDENGFPRKKIQVPIKFGPRAKSHDFRREQEEKERTGMEYVIPLPNMYYKISSLQYDQSRSASTNCIRTWYEDYLISKGVEEKYASILWSDTQPVPYNIGVELTAKADKMSDILQIIEQITSRFNPDAFVFIKEFWFMNIRRDVKMKLDSVNLDYQDEEPGEQAKREVEAKFSFMIEAQMYTKIFDGAIIDQIITVLNPSIAVYKTGTSEFTLRGSSAEPPEFYLSGDREEREKHPLYVNNIIQLREDGPNYGIYEPTEDHTSDFSMTSPGYWTYTSAWSYEEADKYKSLINLSGNYAKEEGSNEDKDTGAYPGSMTVRYNFKKLSEDEEAWTNSGRKDYLNSGNEKIDAVWFSHQVSEIAP